MKVCEGGRDSRSPPLRGRCPAGQRGAVKELNFSILRQGPAHLPFARIDAQSSIAIYFPHNGCVLARVAIVRTKADNGSSQIQGEKP
ncbi:hypothetical protein MESS2_1370040 [Mesorhizobium metallidurans STM 2683]|uniref:Uncharacterized protein n=1 Tax=Mesorhizobium metallidurans STM 2683 TaxID=1297569 RepID=M5EKR2_9HYPH|nr:hypothetical protein MESS2_1370040 [Mesorhizobium metallidurans STM 2683]